MSSMYDVDPNSMCAGGRWEWYTHQDQAAFTPNDYLADPLSTYAHLGMPKPYVRLVGRPPADALDARCRREAASAGGEEHGEHGQGGANGEEG
ncbi:hypothetical protein CPC08DRAFT_768234 [Agrocybe pediades]|nr:hypothetical protein CPC08DRAFT_768234 [Agrocybe pediades]